MGNPVKTRDIATISTIIDMIANDRFHNILPKIFPEPWHTDHVPSLASQSTQLQQQHLCAAEGFVNAFACSHLHHKHQMKKNVGAFLLIMDDVAVDNVAVKNVAVEFDAVKDDFMSGENEIAKDQNEVKVFMHCFVADSTKKSYTD